MTYQNRFRQSSEEINVNYVLPKQPDRSCVEMEIRMEEIPDYNQIRKCPGKFI